MAITVTATQSVQTSNGIQLQVKVLTGAVEAGGASVANSSSSAAAAGTLTPNASNSLLVYALTSDQSGATFTAAANNTFYNNATDGTNLWTYAQGFYSGTVTAGSGVTCGSSAPTGNFNTWAIYEIKPTGGSTPTVDASSPALAGTTGGITIQTAAFSPPPGSVLVAMISSDSTGTGVQTMTVSGGGLVWTARASSNPSGAAECSYVYTASVPPAGFAGAAQPGSTWKRRFHHPQQLPYPPGAPAAAAAAVLPAEVLPPAHRAAAPPRARLGRFGAAAAGILAVTTLSPQPSAVPPSRPQPSIGHPAPHRAIIRGILASPQLARLTAPLPPTAISPRPAHRATGKGVLAKTTLSPQPTVVNVLPQAVPVRRPGPHRVLWRGITGPAPAAVVVAAVPPARPQPPTYRPPAPHRATVRGILAPAVQPVLTAKLSPTAVSRRPQHRAIPVADGIAAVTNLSPQPTRVPPPQWRQPNAPRPAHRGTWRAITGPAPAVVVVAAVPPSRPQPTVNRPPAPHRAVTRWVLAKTTLSAQPTRVPPPQWRQPNAPRPAHRAIWDAIAGPAPPPPPFQVARSTPTVADPRDGTATVTRNVTSSPTVTDPRDGTAGVT